MPAIVAGSARTAEPSRAQPTALRRMSLTRRCHPGPGGLELGEHVRVEPDRHLLPRIRELRPPARRARSIVSARSGRSRRMLSARSGCASDERPGPGEVLLGPFVVVRVLGDHGLDLRLLLVGQGQHGRCGEAYACPVMESPFLAACGTHRDHADRLGPQEREDHMDEATIEPAPAPRGDPASPGGRSPSAKNAAVEAREVQSARRKGGTDASARPRRSSPELMYHENFRRQATPAPRPLSMTGAFAWQRRPQPRLTSRSREPRARHEPPLLRRQPRRPARAHRERDRRPLYLDPPFNSNASYNVLFKGPSGNASAAQIEAFDDTWHWTDAAEDAFQRGAAAPAMPPPPRC